MTRSAEKHVKVFRFSTLVFVSINQSFSVKILTNRNEVFVESFSLEKFSVVFRAKTFRRIETRCRHASKITRSPSPIENFFSFRFSSIDFRFVSTKNKNYFSSFLRIDFFSFFRSILRKMSTIETKTIDGKQIAK